MADNEFRDEFMIKARREREKLEEERHSEEVVTEELSGSIQDEVVYIFGIPVIFKDFDILENRMTFRMPADFIARTEEEIASVYMLGSKPQYVFSNGYLYFMAAFNWTGNLIADRDIFDFTRFAKQAIERIGPKARMLEEDKLQREDGKLAILQFIAQTIDSVNYNVMFFCSLEGRLLIGSITFDQKYRKRLQPIAVEMAKSLHIKLQKEEMEE